MMRTTRRVALLGAGVAAMIFQTPAWATNGYFQNGVSVRSKGMAGAGVADAQTPLVIADNPAGIAEIDSQIEIGFSIFSPRRQMTGSGGPGFTPSGTVKSGTNYFLLPNMAYSHKIDEDSAFTIALYGNGGMNTSYGAPANPACVSPPMPAPNGIFCGGKTGVNLMQMFVSAGYARKLGDMLTVGVAPMFAMQLFKADGLAAFSYDMSGNPLTVDPTKLTDNGYSTSTGFGVRVGALLKLSPAVRIGASYQTKMNMSRLKKYAGLFENGGDFDIPSTFTIGASFSPSPDFTLSTDYRHINYSDVAAVSNSSTTPAQFGSPGGPGFGWKNVDEFKVGAEARASDALTLRAGASFSNNPVPGSDATMNILAPGVTTRHYTVGARIATGKSSAFDLALLYAPKERTTGIEITPAGPNPGHLIELEMHQYEFGLAWTHKF